MGVRIKELFKNKSHARNFEFSLEAEVGQKRQNPLL